MKFREIIPSITCFKFLNLKGIAFMIPSAHLSGLNFWSYLESSYQYLGQDYTTIPKFLSGLLIQQTNVMTQVQARKALFLTHAHTKKTPQIQIHYFKSTN